MTGNWIGFVTALLTFLAVAWQGYTEYQRQHPTPVVPIVQHSPPPSVPVYWQEGDQWYCRVNGQILVWRPAPMPAHHDVAQHGNQVRR